MNYGRNSVFPFEPQYTKVLMGLIAGHVAGIPLATAIVYISLSGTVNTAGTRIIPVAALAVIALWSLIKIYQTCLAGIAHTEYSTSSVIVGLLMGILATSVLMAGIGIVLSIFMVIIPDTATWIILLSLGILSIPVTAWFFTLERIMNFQEAWRPLEAYWKPFYAGVINQMERPIEEEEEEEEEEDLSDEDTY